MSILCYARHRPTYVVGTRGHQIDSEWKILPVVVSSLHDVSKCKTSELNINNDNGTAMSTREVNYYYNHSVASFACLITYVIRCYHCCHELFLWHAKFVVPRLGIVLTLNNKNIQYKYNTFNIRTRLTTGA